MSHLQSSCGTKCSWLSAGRGQGSKLQALVYNMLPSTTAVFSYAIGPRKLSANEHFFCWCTNSRKFVPNNPNYIRRLFYNWPCCLRQLIWNQNRLNRDGILFFFSFLPVVDAPHVYVRALALGCFHCLIGTRTFQRTLTASLDSCAEIKSAPSVA